ncbi:MAG: DinB family protein [Bacteroidota bacterium]
MEQIRWFDRKFDFSFQQNVFPSIVERLSGTHVRLKSKIEAISSDLLEIKPGGKWSIKENIGHLCDLEPLWQGRLDDILNRAKYLRPTDLENKKTEQALHTDTDVDDLLTQFREVRSLTLEQLANLEEPDVFKFALHPRLEQPMRTMDLFLFVAEHDDHHLSRITEIKKICRDR